MNVHSTLLTVICDHCGKGFSTKAGLTQHLKYNHNTNLKKCEICHKYFRKLNLHIENIHENVGMVNCEVCGKPIKRSYYQHHMKNYHTQVKERACNECGKVFKCRSSYAVHMKVHKGRRYPCRFCGMDIAVASHRTKHEKDHHLEQYLQMKAAIEEDQRRPPEERILLVPKE